MVPQLFSGARALIQLNRVADATGKVEAITLALAMDVSVNVRESVRETYVLGELNAMSLDPVGIDVDCSIGRVVPVNRNNAAVSGQGTTALLVKDVDGKGEPLATESNGRKSGRTATDLGLERTISDMIKSETITISIVDTQTDKVIASVKEARFAGRTLSTSAGDVANERLNFVGIYDTGGDDSNSPAKLGYEGSNA